MHHLGDEIRKTFRGIILFDEPLNRHTSLKVGGPADLFVMPEDVADLQALMALLAENGIPWFIIGGGFNLLVRDGGFRGAAISLKKLNGIELRGNHIHAEAGATNQALALFARDSGLAGLEFLAGIPGSLGGAIRMNAGAHGSETFDLVVSVELISDGRRQKREKMSLNYGYRSLQLVPNEFIISAEFFCPADSREAIAKRMDDCLLQRRATQQVGLPNAGSFFKNPPGRSAWRLIDEAGLRGATVGGAQVSEVHSNFLVNRGGAVATDFLQLEALIKERVMQKCGVQLEEEVRVIGVDPE